ncbi:MAG: class I SAM-dependent methyltransferase [Nanoarchaeota archaeon]|nr:class I SAM-dependent methyltransferase [Nanoarchaeota archaeon]
MEDYKKKTIESYDKNAREFSEKFAGLFGDIEKHAIKFMDILNGKKILDLGCGNGRDSEYFLSNGFDVASIDLSEGMIKLCKGKGLRAEVMDIEDLKFEEKSFDGVWAVTSLLHIPKERIKTVVNSLNRILKDRGILCITMQKGDGEEYRKDGRYFVYWKTEELIEKFKDKFEFISSSKDRVGDTDFLGLFFRKK